MTLPRTHSQEPISKARLRLWLKFIKTQGLIEAELRRRLREDFDTTLPRFDVMSALSRAPKGLKMSEISGLLKVSNGNITGIVDRLTQDGLAIRVAVPGDRRAQMVCLTQAGQVTFNRWASAHEKWVNTLLGDVDAQNLGELQTLLDTMANQFDTTE